MESNYLYLFINIFTISGPLLLSFDKKVAFYQMLPKAFMAAAIVAVPFLIWDEIFTRAGFWGFNPDYLSGIYFGSLPLEEVLFFFTIPIACTFIYAVINNWFPTNALAAKEKRITSGLFIFLIPLVIIHHEFWYTSTTFSLLAIFLGYLRWYQETPYMHFIYRAYLVCLIPFCIVNGILTGSMINSPVVWYNENAFTSIRLGTIPFEDFIYAFLLILANIVVIERLSERKSGLIR
ncbi:MAG: lycopene cyclase domain-containing protein [Salibacteraceae bacterium]|jgi:lycopene cyclase domain-containing protein|tara:strand:+ start:1545 stop:2249 length:705 start_codon:yes stop_codon:yes gene_type:complete